MKNTTEVSAFILLGLTSTPELQLPLFAVFLLVYLLTLVGNLGMTLVILLDPRLHTPMYFFLSSLSLVDFGYSSTITPKVLAGLLMGDKLISHYACTAQMFFFVLFVTSENYLLASMAYDRFAAMCKPLHYPVIMTRKVCARLAFACYTSGFLTAVVSVGDTFCLPFCVTNVVHHFFCDIPAVMTLACSDKHINELILFFLSSFNIFFALLIILICYLIVLTTVLKMQSGKGYQKALFICASHLLAVSLFYGTVIFMYQQPSSSHSMDTDKMASVFYSMVIPMLNPLVYSLRNKEVKSAFKKAAEKAKYSLGLVI
ncbi:olfactory receptor 5B17 [Fukomys damarensis]|uniref:Olfactory receptor n=1 Tax=Fukomys damarensis TaxID=885580 RepID=A0A091DH09_FUKDA|nr:olfactory receptor 5B17 [Fukomys damarensis]KFO29565.1 Olfactory receptor 5B17 [Fukomys damarensis]